jgi:hypothetical protein
MKLQESTPKTRAHALRLSSSLLAAAALLFADTHSRAWDQDDEGKCPASGVYENRFHGFQVTIPDGLKGCPDSPVGFTDHGVLIAIDLPSGRAIDCFAAYNAPMYENARAAADADLDYLRGSAAPGSVNVVSRRQTRLGTLPAERLVVRYKGATDGVERVQDSIHALRPSPKGQDTLSREYTVSLDGRTEAYRNDVSILERVLKSWKLLETAD